MIIAAQMSKNTTERVVLPIKVQKSGDGYSCSWVVKQNSGANITTVG